jgi:hypothetical protein
MKHIKAITTTCGTYYKQQVKHYHATFETSHLPHSKAIHETLLCNKACY